MASFGALEELMLDIIQEDEYVARPDKAARRWWGKERSSLEGIGD